MSRMRQQSVDDRLSDRTQDDRRQLHLPLRATDRPDDFVAAAGNRVVADDQAPGQGIGVRFTDPRQIACRVGKRGTLVGPALEACTAQPKTARYLVNDPKHATPAFVAATYPQ